ncbi:assimilatory nitrate reductase NasA [Halorubrum luteum]
MDRRGSDSSGRPSANADDPVAESVPTTCMRCAVGCGLRQRADRAGGLDVVRGDPDSVVSSGLACRRGLEETATPAGERLTRPLVRRDGTLEPATWEEALSRTTERLRAVIDADPDRLAVLGSGQQTNEAAYALGKLARGGIGTRLYDANTTLCMASAVRAYVDAFGSDAPPPTYDDVPAADVHLVWGANPAVAHPVLFRWIEESATHPDGALVVVDPVGTATADRADHHVRPDPGGDHALARAVLARIVDTGRVDEAFVDAHTTGFSALRESLPDPAAAAAEAGVPAETVDRLARLLDRRTLVYWGMGVNQSVRGTATAGALIDLCLATGSLGEGQGPFSLTGQANSMGARLCASKGSWPGHRKFTAPTHRRVVADAWDVPCSRLPTDPGPGPVGVLDADPDAVWTVATNPAAGMPDAGPVRRTLADAFLVVQDAFRTETVELADVVLPAATWGETEGTTTNMERRISRVRAATAPPGDARSDLGVIVALANRIAPELFAETGADPVAVFEEFTALTAGTPADCSGISYDRLADGAVRWPAPTADRDGGYRYRTDEPAEAESGGSDDGWSFPTPTGRAAFSAHDAPADPDPIDGTFPLVLTTGRRSDAYNTGVRSRDGGEQLTARIAPETVVDGGVAAESDDGPVDLVTRRGRVRARLEMDPAVPADIVWLPIHHPATNELTVAATDPHSAEPHYKSCAVRIESVE